MTGIINCFFPITSSPRGFAPSLLLNLRNSCTYPDVCYPKPWRYGMTKNRWLRPKYPAHHPSLSWQVQRTKPQLLRIFSCGWHLNAFAPRTCSSSTCLEILVCCAQSSRSMLFSRFAIIAVGLLSVTASPSYVSFAKREIGKVQAAYFPNWWVLKHEP